MGCYIYSCAEAKISPTEKWEPIKPEIFPLDDSARKWYKKDFTDQLFHEQSYALFGFLADVRNYSRCPPIAPPRGLPNDWFDDEKAVGYNAFDYEDASSIKQDNHSHSWLLLQELIDFDYEQSFWDQREYLHIENGKDLQIQGRYITYREHLGEKYFNTLEILCSLGAPNCVLVVFWFDS